MDRQRIKLQSKQDYTNIHQSSFRSFLLHYKIVVRFDYVVRRDLLAFEGFHAHGKGDLPAGYSTQFQQGTSPGYQLLAGRHVA
jgi:hypothetical protein